ncbi:MAG: DUF2283 domain-containing protein [Alphaproteobacteria bacterium]
MAGLTHFLVRRPQLQADYDRDSDVLYLTLGSPRPGEGEQKPKGVVLRYSMDTEIPIGVTVIGVRSNGWTTHVSELASIVASHVDVVPAVAERTILQAIK